MSKKNIEIRNGGDVLIECLLKEGVKYLFGIPGGQLLAMYDAIYRWGKKKGIETIMVRHEQAGAHAADAYSRVAGKLGVCFGTVGPGVTDMVPGVGAAWSDNIPLLVVGAQIKRKLDGKSCLQGDLDQMTLMKPITKAQFQIQSPLEIPKIIQKAIRTAFSGRRGPVYVDIREDALIGKIPSNANIEILPPEKYRPKASFSADPMILDEVVDLLKVSKKPLIICGGEVAAFGASKNLKRISVTYSIPAGTSLPGIDGISSDMATYLGAGLISDALMNTATSSDLVISVGCKWGYGLSYGLPPLWPKNQKLIQINIDSVEIGKNRPVNVAIVGDCKIVLNHLLKKMEENLPKEKITEWTQWNAEQQEFKRMLLNKLYKKMNSDKVPILPQRLFKELNDVVSSDTILVFDGGDILIFAAEQVASSKPRSPRTTLFPFMMGHLGAGIPFALGAKIAHPDKNVGLLVGDGSFLFNIQELETAVRYNLPIVIIIANNNSWGMIKSTQSVMLGRRYIDTDFPDIDYAKIAEGFGCYTETVIKPNEIQPALQRALESGKPAVLDVKIQWMIPKATKLMNQLGLV